MRAFLDGKPVDRIPNGWGGCETAGLHNIAYHRLKHVLGVDDRRNRVRSGEYVDGSIARSGYLDGSRLFP